MKHTPTPWKWQDRYDFREHIEHRKLGLEADCENIRDGRISLVDAEGNVILEEWGEYASDSGLSITKENAEYIVKCVNSHDELLESAKDAYEQLRLINSVSSKDEDLQTKLEAMEMLEKAITASLGKEME